MPSSGPVPIMAHGGEMVVPKAAVRAGAVSSTVVNRNYSIDARGAQAGVADQIVAHLNVYDTSLDRTLPKWMSERRGCDGWGAARPDSRPDEKSPATGGM